jgi:hypothetical protein
MKIFALFTIFFLAINTFGQRSEELIPSDAISVFSINNVNLLQKISLDELVMYEFMEEVQQELFDGSTSGKTLKDSGIDFDQKLNIFYGKNREYEVSGLTFGITNKDELFSVFDDFHPIESDYPGVTFYLSYFNRIAIKGSSGILFRVSPNSEFVDKITDSIWYARGNENEWYLLDESYEEEFVDSLSIEKSGEEIDFYDEMEIEENTSAPIDNKELPVADENPGTKTYFELRDSVEMRLQQKMLKDVCDNLFLKGNTLLKEQSDFAELLNHDSEGVFYFDNSSGNMGYNNYSDLLGLSPSLYEGFQELYHGNIFLGDLMIKDNSIELIIDAHYGEKLGSIYEKMTSAKFDKNVLKYIHKDYSAFFTYTINLREAYKQTYDVLMPMAESEENESIAISLLIIELLDELLNKDAIFDAYKGSMFGAYNGIKKVKTEKIIYEYEEETFEYIEQRVEAEEDMPIFVLGFSTNRSDLPDKILKRIARITDKCHFEGNYWVYEDGVMNAAPLYMINKNGLFIFTNDEDLAINHHDGYGANSLGKKMAKRAKKSGFVYASADLGQAIENLPSDLFNDQQNEMLDVLRGKSGKIELTSSKTSSNKTTFSLVYNFIGEYDASGTYILDLINSLYVISK